MRRLLIYLVALICCSSAFAQSRTNKDFRDGLEEIIRAKVGNCTYDSSDNSLNFNDGEYWIIVYNESAPFMIDFHMEGIQINPSNNMASVLERCNRANSEVMGGKAYLAITPDNYLFVNFAVQFSLSSPDEMKRTLNAQMKILQELKTAYQRD